MFVDRKLTNRRAASAAVFLLMLGLLGGCAKDLVTGKKAYNWFSVGEDVKLGNQVLTAQLNALKKKGKKVDSEADAETYERIRRTTLRIGAVSHYPSFPYEAHYADLDVVNAWCAPGGKVMVYTGLFDPKKGLVSKEREDELAAVLGHEIAHATARHVSESLSRNFTILAVGQIAVSAIASSGTGTLQNAFNRVIVEGINLYVPFYTRSNETEADRIGLMYMAKAGYNPRAAVDLWYRACKKRGDPMSLYASHPSSCQRAKDLEAHLPAALAEYEKFKK
jgi:predicted Zn-dependent protease